MFFDLSAIITDATPYLLWAIAACSAMVGIVVLMTVLQRLKNNRMDSVVREFIEKIETYFDNRGAAVNLINSTPSEIRAIVTPKYFGAFERFLRNRISRSDASDWDIHLCREIAQKSGFTKKKRRCTKSGRMWKRAMAIRTLGYLRDSQNRSLFREVIDQSSSSQLCFSASMGLALMGDVEYLIRIMEKLYPDASLGRDRALSIVTAYGSAACPKIAGLLTQNGMSDSVKTVFLDYLRINSYKEGQESIVTLAKGSQNPEVLIHAVEALGIVGDSNTVSFIEQFCDSSDFRLRLKSIVAIGLLDGAKSEQKLRAALDDPDWWVRRNAAEALVAIQGIQSLEMVVTEGQGVSPAARIAKLVIDENKFGRKRMRYRFGDYEHIS